MRNKLAIVRKKYNFHLFFLLLFFFNPVAKQASNNICQASVYIEK